MITLFHVLQLTGLIVGGLTGYRVGHLLAGNAGAILGTAAGIPIGWLTGRLPLVLTLRALVRSLKRSGVAELRSRLDREYFISHWILAELASRGEPVESFRPVVLAQLNSGSADVRRFGRVNAKMWCPDLLAKSAGRA